jgi:PAS domain S-box-containing protein
LLLDLGREIVSTNPRAAKLLGRTEVELARMKIGELFPGVSCLEDEDFLGKLLRAPISSLELPLKLEGQEETILSVSASAVADKTSNAEEPAGAVVILRDITERRRAEAALVEAANSWRTTFDAISDSVCVLSRSYELIEVNEAACKSVGLNREQIVGRKCFEVLHGRSTPLPECPCASTLTSGEPATGSYESNGRTFEISAWPVLDADRNVTAFVHVTRDITERIEVEGQLAQADRLSSMGMLAAGVAHEINNPLSYVLYNLESLTEDLPQLLRTVRRAQAGLAELAESNPALESMGELAAKMNPALLDDIQERFKDALGGTHRIRDIARGLGTFSRVEEDQLVPVNLMHVIEVAINMSYNEVKYRARLVKDYARTPTVMASEGRLSQVFLNLIINATQAIEEGNVEDNEIRVRTWTEDGAVFAEVRDTGRGIPRENLARLFEPFFTTKKIGVGSGLGLAISRNIIESYGGTIEVQSRVGQGTSFTIRLPLRAADADSTGGSSAAAAETRARGRILVVDDEDRVRATIARMLREHETVQAAGGAEARAILEEDQAFDVILCDMMMPDISGMDLHRWLARDHPVLGGRLIFITGGTFTPLARSYLGSVDNLRLEKPFDVANLKRIVNDRVIMAQCLR